MHRFTVTYLGLLTAATIAAAPFPTPLSRIDAPVIPQRATVLGYDRTEFGPGWGPAAPGCDTRAAVLARDFHADCTHHWRTWGTGPAGHPATPTMPTIEDPYTGSPLSPADVEIDHILPVSAAWDLGAHRWDQAARSAFYNDPANLIAVSSAVNQAKGNKLPSEWMPPRRRARCAYGHRLVAVAKHYALPLPAADVRAIRRACAGVSGLLAARELSPELSREL